MAPKSLVLIETDASENRNVLPLEVLEKVFYEIELDGMPSFGESKYPIAKEIPSLDFPLAGKMASKMFQL